MVGKLILRSRWEGAARGCSSRNEYDGQTLKICICLRFAFNRVKNSTKR